MPEGPEVKTIADKLRDIIVNKTIIKSRFKNANNQKIERVTSYGKKLIFHLSNDQAIVTSFGMEGRWLINQKGNHTHSYLALSDNITLYYDDSRKFGSVKLIPNIDLYLHKYGPDMLDDPISEQDWINIFQHTGRRQISTVITDQHVIAGVGNYLKSEILYDARIRPDRVTLSVKELLQLRKSTYKIIQESYRHNGLTLRTYWAPDGTKGTYHHRVYQRETDPYGNHVRASTFNDGRTTFWVPTLQN